VYDWGRIPLLLGATLFALVTVRHMRRRDVGALTLAGLLVLAVLAQAVPVPGALRAALTAADSFNGAYHVSLPQASGWAPISVVPAATFALGVRAAVFALFCIALTSSLRRNARTVALLSRNVLVIAAVIALEAIVQKGTFNGKIYWFWESSSRAAFNYYGPFVNRNHFAGWMILAAPLAAGWVMAETSKAAAQLKPGWRQRAVWLSSAEATALMLGTTAILVMFVALIWSMSRSGIAGGAVAVLAIAIVAGSRTKGPARRVLVPGVVMLLLIAAIAMKGADQLATWYSTTNTLQWRFNHWRDAMAPLRDFWIVGSGVGAYGALTLIYPQSDPSMHVVQAHNDYLQLAIEGGLLVGFPTIVAIVVLIRTVALRLRAPQDERTWWIRVGAVAGLCGIAVQEVTDFSLQIPGVTLIFVVVVAIAIHEPPFKENEGDGRMPALRLRPS
jgi:O-antigen ligase